MNRIDILGRREEKIKDYQEQVGNCLKDFILAGKQLSNTKEGKQFFLLAKEIYYNENEYQRDNFYTNDPLLLARLNGEDYILRNIILQFINNREE
jgi:hypothetical protein